MKSLGICIGASTIQCVIALDNNGIITIENSFRVSHEGEPRKHLIEIIASNSANVDKIALTGHIIEMQLTLSKISEAQALELAIQYEFAEHIPESLISFGAETLIAYKLNKKGEISSVYSKNKCASGTGEFFLQQIRRMGITIEEATELALKGRPKKIAGRCSVFCKSDCTHALNKGEPKENITAGLCAMMASKVKDLAKEENFIAIIGGTTKNTAMINDLKIHYKNVLIPKYATTFEALGVALWALKNQCITLPNNISSVFDLKKISVSGFKNHPQLINNESRVIFKSEGLYNLKINDECILGLDVGSTTTKAVLIRKSDKHILCSTYLRTNGNPIDATKKCIKEINDKIINTPLSITGLGITGSGRKLVALLCNDSFVVNEITAHASAATFYDKDVDTIFEIGGQDAKYTYITNGTPTDYAMNEACSAGTGSFLEESAIESLETKTEDIGPLAQLAKNPLNFSDQCSAFISSDIKKASREGADKNDILAGLVYSICQNYLDRVKGRRKTGKKIFMQGGVCYNKAVPIAMSVLLKTQIVVPPNAGLMGAFGAGLEVIKSQNNCNLLTNINLTVLCQSEFSKIDEFTCHGKKNECDLNCVISRFNINKKPHLFGGACERYYVNKSKKDKTDENLNYVEIRQKLLLEDFAPDKNKISTLNKTVGIPRSFLFYQLYPLYSNFFSNMGFKIILSDIQDKEGESKIKASFCYPAELGYSAFYSVLKQRPDYIFLPQVMQIPVPNVPTYSRQCLFVQAEPYYLNSTFRKEIDELGVKIISPVLKMERGYKTVEEDFLNIAKSLQVELSIAKKAFDIACDKQINFEKALKTKGLEALEYLKNNPDKFGIVVFGRPYNSFATEANMGIPKMISSKGFITIPYDMLMADSYNVHFKMFWSSGQKIMKAAQFVKDSKNLFAVFITNFSCGPDSFLLGFFRNLMKDKPSLTLELDQHTADAGIETRIEAASDIMKNYFNNLSVKNKSENDFTPAKIIYSNNPEVLDSDGNKFSIKDSRVEVILPSMGKYGTEALASVLNSIGVNAKALPISNEETLVLGKQNTLCKECLPYILTTGSFVKYLKNKKDPNVITLFFMATGGGPCRLGQYWKALEELIENNKIKNAAIFTMTDENSYAGLGSNNLLTAWQSILVSDIFGDIHSVISAYAVNKEESLELLENQWKIFLNSTLNKTKIIPTLKQITNNLAKIKLTSELNKIPIVSLLGEIFVRKDEFSRKNIVNYLEKNGFAVRVAPVGEFLLYGNYVIDNGLGEKYFSVLDRVKLFITHKVQEWWEKKIKSIFAKSGLYHYELIDVKTTIKGISHLINENLRGETILTTGLAMREILNPSCGVISIGPFGCMPLRISEAILKNEMTSVGKKRMSTIKNLSELIDADEEFPFLSLETDGGPFNQSVEANLEAFVLRAKRLSKKLSA